MSTKTMQEIYPGYIPLDDCTENGTYLCVIEVSTGMGCTTEVVMELEDGQWSTDEEPDGIGIFDTDFWDTDRYHTVCKLQNINCCKWCGECVISGDEIGTCYADGSDLVKLNEIACSLYYYNSNLNRC